VRLQRNPFSPLPSPKSNQLIPVRVRVSLHDLSFIINYTKFIFLQPPGPTASMMTMMLAGLMMMAATTIEPLVL
jgi:hypothetical protein